MKAILKYPGGKWRIAAKIIEAMPPHKAYLEPYFGSGAVFFTKTPVPIETINDIDNNVVNLFRVIRNYPDELARLISLTPFSRTEFLTIQEKKAGDGVQLTENEIENARRFIVRCNQGFGSKTSDRVGWKHTRISAGPRNADIWSGIPEIIYQASIRLKEAQIECYPAVELIRKYNHDDCLIYADPPYHGSTRRNRIYLNDMMGDDAHMELINALKSHRGYFILSGYDNELYREALEGYRKIEIESYVNSGRGSIECLWLNF